MQIRKRLEETFNSLSMFVASIQEAKDVETVTQGWCEIKNIPKERLTPKVCLEAVKYCSAQLIYIPIDKRSPEVCLEAVKKNYRELSNVPLDKRTHEIYLEVVKQKGNYLKEIPENERTTDIYLAAVKQKSSLYFEIPKDKRTIEICLAYLQKEPLASRYEIPENIRDEVWAQFLKYDDLALQHFKLDEDEYNKIRENIALSHAIEREKIRENLISLIPHGEFYIKSIRNDQYNFIYPFIEELLNPRKKFPKRRGLHRVFTVTGEGIFSHMQNSIYPFKKPQYTFDEKEHFTNFQSTSFGDESHLPAVFGFDKRNIALAGVLIEGKNVLLSNRLFLYDGGTVGRHYETNNQLEAEEYAKNAINIKLFSKNNFQQFKDAVYKDKRSKYNETLVRLQWDCDGSSQIFIASDTLNSRLLARQYAVTLQAKLIKAGKCSPDYQVPICFYIPNNSDLHFKAYTDEEYQLDKQDALYIFENKELRLKYFADNQYEFLLTLSAKQITEALDQCAIYMLKSGYVHIFRFLLEKTPYSLENKLTQMQTRDDYQSILFSMLEHVVYSGDISLVETILPRINSKIEQPLDKNYIVSAIQNNFFDIAEKLIQSQLFNSNKKNEQGFSALTLAADKGHNNLVKLLTKDATNENIVESLFKLIVYGRTQALKLLLLNMSPIEIHGLIPAAVKHNHPIEVIELLLEKSISIKDSINDRDKEGNTALHIAIMNGQLEIVEFLLKNNANVDEKNKQGEDAFTLAKKNTTKEKEIIELLKTYNNSQNINLQKI